MGSRSSRSSLVKMMILIPLTLDSVALSAVINAGNGIRKIYLPDAVKISRTFPCKDPQTRAYNLRDLMKNVHKNPGVSAEQPIYIKLKRCDGHSGCCTVKDHVCSPVKSEIYYEDVEILISNVVFFENNTQFKKEWIRVEQHGECTCNENTANELNQLDHQHPNVTVL
ncbi:unnamed protein product [Xylocopa violacea]|uniref:Platelet-derived growth factor (PDGF) family profile domain-containing protein n=1 Tax=Xylocopa violacea TaxID=135666 RepID=A0ABP1NQ82_XYLVO